MPCLSGVIMMRARLLIALFVTLTLTACLSPKPPTPTATPTRPPRPTFTPTLVVRTSPLAVQNPVPTPSSTPTSEPTATPTAATTPTPTVNPNMNPLTGLIPTNPAVLSKRPIHICIDNDPGSRPHLGLDRADIVYEYVMERFYNTRFTAVFWGQEAERIGPIRSARLINLEVTPQYDALLVCSGASDPTRWLLITDKRFFDYTYLDIDLHDPNYNYFSIYGKNTRIGTNLLQTSTALMRKWLQDTGKEKSVKVAGFTFSSAGSPPPTGMPATRIVIPYPASCCDVEWIYDATSARYLRVMDGEPHRDGVSKEQLSAANVIIVYAAHQDTDIVEDATGATAIRIVLTGEGKATVFRDGVAISARWKRTGLTDFMQIVDAQGQPMALHPGNSWIEIVPDRDFEVTFK